MNAPFAAKMSRIGFTAIAVVASASFAGGCASLSPSPASGLRIVMVNSVRQRAGEYPGLATSPHFITALTAISQVDRAQFVRRSQRADAYSSLPLPIGFGQTISDPFVVALMTASVETKSGSNVLEVGTGSGYQAAVLSRIGATVHSIEIIRPLADSAARRLRRLGFGRVSVKTGDGFAGWPEFAPYDGVIVTAGASEVPGPLVEQLKPGGKLVMPVGTNPAVEQLIVLTKGASGQSTKCSLGPAMFVPLTGRGWKPEAVAVYNRTIPLCFQR